MQAHIGKTTCPYCGVGCGVNLTIPTQDDSSDQAASIAPVTGDSEHPANFGRLCVKGSSLAQTLTGGGRLLTPKIHGQAASWPQAIDTIADKITQVVAQHGADAFAFYLSGQMLTEDYYVANKLAKGFIGTANVDTNSRLCMSSAVAGYKRAFGSDTVPCNYEDLELCDLLIMVGSNAAWTHPILYQRIVAAKAKRPEMKIVVIDPRKTATCDIADLHLAITPGSDAAIFTSLLVQTHLQGRLKLDYIKQHTQGFDVALTSALAATPTLAAAAAFCGISEADLAQLTRWWCDTEKTVSFYSQGINQSATGVDKCNAIINCHLATGRIGQAGMGPFSITGQPNAMGGREVGGLANQLAAHMDFATPGATALVQRFWQAPNMATDNGLKAIDLFKAVEAGDIKVLWIISTNPMVSLPDSAQVQRALEKCELVIVSDCQEFTDTTAYADVLLPATGWSEKDGTVTNSERRISRQRGLLPAPGEAKHDWWAICEVAKALGFRSAFSYRSVHEIFVEHAALSAFENNGKRDFDIGGLRHLNKHTYDALLPIQWPVTADSPNGTERMFTDGRFYTANKKAQFISITPALPKTSTTSEFPFVLNTGRVRDQWHTMTRTGKAASLSNHTDQPYVEINPEDAQALAVTEKGLLKVSSPLGSVLLRAKITPAQVKGQLFVPIHWTRQFASDSIVSKLVPQVVDPLSGQPESKHAIANVSPVLNLVYGFVISRHAIELTSFDYHCEVTMAQGKRYEVALTEMIELPVLVRQLVNDSQIAKQGTWLDYLNPINGSQRFAYLVNGKMEAVFFFAKSPILPNSDWLSSLLEAPLNAADDASRELTSAERLALTVGTPADVEDKGNIVCACFQVGEKQISTAIENGCHSLEALSAQLKCGTNCGSCIPELKTYVSTLINSAATKSPSHKPIDSAVEVLL